MVKRKETELAKFREDTEIVRKENTSLQMKLATLEASGEETLEEKNNLHVRVMVHTKAEGDDWTR